MPNRIAMRVAAAAAATGVVVGSMAAAPAAFADPTPSTPSTTTPTAPTAPTTQASNPRCTPATLSRAQQQVESALSGRVTRLNTLLGVVNNTGNRLTSDDRQTLSNDISTVELPGIEALQPQAQQATTCRQLRTVARTMVLQYRVYVVMTPQTHLTVVADAETSIAQTIANLEPKIAAAIQSAQAAGKDVSGAQSAFADLQSKVTAAQSTSNGVATQVLAQTPSGYPANWQVFLTARTDLTSGRNDLRAAYADARQIRSDLS
jgi:hypothetical protein